HLELNIVKIDDRCLEHLLSVYSSTQEFELSFNKEKLSAGFAALAKLPKIKSIIFTDDKLSGAPIKEICKIDRTLQLASFRHCGITDDDALSIRTLSIAKLNLADNPITDKGLLNLRGVKGLKELNIEDCNKITENGEAEFARTKPAVRIVKKAPEKVPSREDKLLKEFFAS
ncbi:MAG: hypothetical protein K2Z81_00280, partial [Cyanobacteria bacterium]|nr:hypothetical protein [Cyanobacteriota bacterium]